MGNHIRYKRRVKQSGVEFHNRDQLVRETSLAMAMQFSETMEILNLCLSLPRSLRNVTFHG